MMNERHVLDNEYALKPRAYYSASRWDMQSLVPDGVERLLDVGCGSGEFGRALKQSRAGLHVSGIERTDWAESACRHLDHVLRIDVERDPLTALSTYDCITLNDVLEHLSDPWQVLRKLCAHLRPGGSIVASSPNLRYFEVLKALLLRGRFDYADSGVMDRTHLRFFTMSTFGELFEGAGLRIESLGLHGGDGRLPFKLRVLNGMLGGALDDTGYPQLYCVAKAPR